MYKNVIAALDGSPVSNYGLDTALDIVNRSGNCHLIGCHVYASRLHRTRFGEMEPGLPDQYQEEERLSYLRETHEDLISDGMQIISDSYLAPLAQQAKALNLSFEAATPEGHHYVKLLQLMREKNVDLTILGANGHGNVPEETLGSMAERILLYANVGDLLLMRQPWAFKNRPIIVGIDGSPNSFQALKRAVEVGILMGATVEAVAVYDPFFHSTVFKTIADSLPEESAKRFNFTAQEKLHDEIIDRGLETLYRDGLTRGILLAKEMGVEIKSEVLAGKVFPQIHHYAAIRNASLVVVGRYGLHQEPESKIGSNTHKLARLTPFNFLVVNPSSDQIKLPEIPSDEEQEKLSWDPEAERIVERIPIFVRKMAIRSIESKARERGIDHITADLVMELSGRMKGNHK